MIALSPLERRLIKELWRVAGALRVAVSYLPLRTGVDDVRKPAWDATERVREVCEQAVAGMLEEQVANDSH
jgi:hypothetical protein